MRPRLQTFSLAAATVIALASHADAHGLLVATNGIHLYSAERTPPAGNPTPIPGTPRWEHVYLGAFIPAPAGTSVQRMLYGPDGNLYVQTSPIGACCHAIYRYDVAGTLLGEFLHDGSIGGFAFGPDGNVYTSYMTDQGGQVHVFDGVTGTFLRRFDPPGNGLWYPRDLAFLPNGDLLVASWDGIRRYQGGTGYYMGGGGAPGGGTATAMTLDLAGDRIYVARDSPLQVSALDLNGHEIWSNYLTQRGPPGYIFQVPAGFLYEGALYAGPDCLDRDTGAYLGGPSNSFGANCIAIYRGLPTDVFTPKSHQPAFRVASPADRLQLTYSIDRPGVSRLVVYDARGRVVHRALLDAGQASRRYEWSPGEQNATGSVYFVELKTPSGRQTAKWVRAN